MKWKLCHIQNIIFFFAALKQMKLYVFLSFNKLHLFIACFVFDFHKTVFIVQKKDF